MGSGSGSAAAAMAPRQEVAGAPTPPPAAKQADHETVAANSAVDSQAQQAPGGAGSGSAMGSAMGSAAVELVPTTTGTGTVDAHHAKAPPTSTKDHTIGTGAGNGNGSGGATKVDLKKGGKGGKPATGGSGKSLDDLIDEAAGGSGDSKKPPSGGDTKPTLDKKELTSGDIRTAMGSVTKRAQACYDKFNQGGTVGVKASVAPSGQITKVTITGAFAGTPTGDCVASVVQGVSFPAWDGAPMTVNYSYLLSE
jgi:hypothetical protein